MALTITLIGFLGGLVLSAIKRDRGVKDWGHLIDGPRRNVGPIGLRGILRTDLLSPDSVFLHSVISLALDC